MKLKKFAATFLTVVIAASAFTCFASAEDINASGHGWVRIIADTPDAKAGSTIHWHVFDVNDMPKQIDLPATWSVSDSSVASIVGNGSSATMTVHKNCSSVDVKATIDGQTTVQTYKTYWDDNANKATAVNLNTNAVTITDKGNTAKVAVSITKLYPGKPGDDLPSSIVSSNKSVATAALDSNWDNGDRNIVITAKGSGTCTITVKTASGPSASCSVTVGGNTPASNINSNRTFISDTNSDIAVDGAYTFKITSQNGATPTFAVGTPGIFSTQLVQHTGTNYFYKVTAIGSVGAQAGIYVNGPKLLVATVKKNASAVLSDTRGNFNVKAGKSYVFKLTASSKPTFCAGSPAAFKASYVNRIGNNYYFRVTATGKVGSASGFYIGGQNGPVAIATVTK